MTQLIINLEFIGMKITDSMNVKFLKKTLSALGQSTTGLKAELIRRLQDYQVEQNKAYEKAQATQTLSESGLGDSILEINTLATGFKHEPGETETVSKMSISKNRL